MQGHLIFIIFIIHISSKELREACVGFDPQNKAAEDGDLSKCLGGVDLIPSPSPLSNTVMAVTLYHSSSGEF